MGLEWNILADSVHGLGVEYPGRLSPWAWSGISWPTQSMGLEWNILADSVHGLGVNYSDRGPWARSGLF